MSIRLLAFCKGYWVFPWTLRERRSQRNLKSDLFSLPIGQQLQLSHEVVLCHCHQQAKSFQQNRLKIKPCRGCWWLFLCATVCSEFTVPASQHEAKNHGLRHEHPSSTMLMYMLSFVLWWVFGLVCFTFLLL